MTKKIRFSDCRPFDIAEYLDVSLEDNDPAMLSSPLAAQLYNRFLGKFTQTTKSVSDSFVAFVAFIVLALNW